jgi:hypothetical protein
MITPLLFVFLWHGCLSQSIQLAAAAAAAAAAGAIDVIRSRF